MSGTSTALSGSSEVTTGARYRVRGWSAVADAKGHPQTPVGIPAPTPDAGTLDPYLELPASMPDVISDTARAVVDDAGAGSDPAGVIWDGGKLPRPGQEPLLDRREDVRPLPEDLGKVEVVEPQPLVLRNPMPQVGLGD